MLMRAGLWGKMGWTGRKDKEEDWETRRCDGRARLFDGDGGIAGMDGVRSFDIAAVV